MFNKFSRVIMIALVALIAFSCVAMASQTNAPDPYSKQPTQYLTGKGWEPWTKKIMNQMFDIYGKNNPSYNPENRPYVIWDCDNTITLTDVQEQLFIYQIENLRFAVHPSEMYKVATAGVPDVNMDLGKDYNNKTVDMIARDTVAAYTNLWKKGWIAPDNSKAKHKAEWMKSDDWKEFATKTRLLYDAIGDSTSVSVSYPWIGFYFTGMTRDQAEQLAFESHKYYVEYGKKSPKNWTKGTWESPKNYKSHSGPFSVSFRVSTGIPPENLEIIKKLDANGIDVWICSASPVVAIRGLQRYYQMTGLRDMVCMTYKQENGKYIPMYDYEHSPQTQGVGKSETVVQRIQPFYNGKGPIAGFGDSQGDYNFMTEFKDTVAGIMYNRVRKDDAGIIAAIAVYQNEKKMDLYDAMKKGEIRFTLQGRQENGGYLVPQPASIMLGKNKPQLLHEKAEGWKKMLENGMTTTELLNKCTALTGKLKTYVGAKTR